jgi:D-ribulokinase
MDHRSIPQAERINALGHDVLRYVGNRISPEMETPKLLWLKENRPEAFQSTGHFFDLADYLTWRLTGCLERSICTTTCKWTYLGHERRWDNSYFHAIGLGELADEGFIRIGTKIVDAGDALGGGLTASAAADFGLVAGTPVAAGLIDAHAGGIGTVGASGRGAVTSRMAYVFGTSACTMTSTAEPAFIPGVWGPYFSAMIPGLWLNEAGQSAAGAAIDHLVAFHPAAQEALARANEASVGLTTWLAQQASLTAGDPSRVALLADGLHIVPEFLGNRAPFADPDARGLIAGLDMDQSIGNLVKFYIAGVCSLGYGLRQIIDAQRARRVDVDMIVVSGGAGQNDLVRQLLADATNIQVIAPKTEEPVLLGSAMLGAVASGCYPDLAKAMSSMSVMGKVFDPASGELPDWHRRRFEGFELLQAAGHKLRLTQ